MSRQTEYLSQKRQENELSDITTALESVESKYDSNRCNGDLGDSVSRTLESIDRPISELCTMIRNYMSKKHEEEKRAQIRSAIESEWKYLGVILDRTFMITYLTVVVVSVAMLFPR